MKIAIFRLPFRGPTDEFLPLRGDPGMLASWCRPQDFEDEFGDSADVIVLPGSGATVRDLDYLRGVAQRRQEERSHGVDVLPYEDLEEMLDDS